MELGPLVSQNAYVPPATSPDLADEMATALADSDPQQGPTPMTREIVTPLPSYQPQTAPSATTDAPAAGSGAKGHAKAGNGDLQSQVAQLQQEVAELSRALQFAQTNGMTMPGLAPSGLGTNAQGNEASLLSTDAGRSLMGISTLLQNEFLGAQLPEVQSVESFYSAHTGEPLP